MIYFFSKKPIKETENQFIKRNFTIILKKKMQLFLEKYFKCSFNNIYK